MQSLYDFFQALAPIGVMRDRYCMHVKGDSNLYYSPDDLLKCCDECGAGCGGGYPSLAFKYHLDHGLSNHRSTGVNKFYSLTD